MEKRKTIMHDFFRRRLSIVGLARKYSITVEQVEQRIRRAMR